MDGCDHCGQILLHHIQQELCTTRALYRQGKKLTAVKVYTVSKESQHLLVYRVPAVGLAEELEKLCKRFGQVTKSHLVHVAESEEFTEVFHIRYEKIKHARFAKRQLDNRSFFGGVLHVCYAPELETIEETRYKLINRRNEIAYYSGRKLFNSTIIKSSRFISKTSKARKSMSIKEPPHQPNNFESPQNSTFSKDLPGTSSWNTGIPLLSQYYNFNRFTLQPQLYGSVHTPAPTLYPSQQVLTLPGTTQDSNRLDAKPAIRLIPASVLKKKATPRIVFHNKPNS